MRSLLPTQSIPSQLLATPTDVWEKAMPKHAVSPASFDPGFVSEVTRTGPGIGVMTVNDLPIDGYRINVQITQAGNTEVSLGAVTVVRAAASTGTLEVSGTPAGSYAARVQIVAGGTRGTARFRWSTNGGTSWSPDILMPLSGIYAPPLTGLTFYFSGAFDAADLFSFVTIGLAKFTWQLFALAPPVEKEGTGDVIPSGMPTRKTRVALWFTREGTLGSAQFRYSINGGAFYPAQTIPLGGSWDIPGLGITLTFDPGPGPVFWKGNEIFFFTAYGPLPTLTIGPDPVHLKSPIDTGLRLLFLPTDPAGAVNFLVGDTFSFYTLPSPELISHIKSASDMAASWIQARYKRPYLAWDDSVTEKVCHMVRYTLLSRKGMVPREDKTFEKDNERAEAWFLRVARKEQHPLIVEGGSPVVLSPSVHLGPDDHEIMEGTSNQGGP